jgi:hypothetical protein
MTAMATPTGMTTALTAATTAGSTCATSVTATSPTATTGATTTSPTATTGVTTTSPTATAGVTAASATTGGRGLCTATPLGFLSRIVTRLRLLRPDGRNTLRDGNFERLGRLR